MNKIVLYRTPAGWMARHEGPHADRIFEAFGTFVVPTAFTAQAAAVEVQKTIQALNPAIVVEVIR